MVTISDNSALKSTEGIVNVCHHNAYLSNRVRKKGLVYNFLLTVLPVKQPFTSFNDKTNGSKSNSHKECDGQNYSRSHKLRKGGLVVSIHRRLKLHGRTCGGVVDVTGGQHLLGELTECLGQGQLY